MVVAHASQVATSLPLVATCSAVTLLLAMRASDDQIMPCELFASSLVLGFMWLFPSILLMPSLFVILLGWGFDHWTMHLFPLSLSSLFGMMIGW